MSEPEAPASPDEAEPSPGGEANPDLLALLEAYGALLGLADSRDVRRLRVLRVAVWFDRFLIERVRLVVDALARGYSARAASGQIDPATDEADRRRLLDFVSSLPPPLTLARRLWLLIPIYVVARVLLGWVVPRILSSFKDASFSGGGVQKVRTGELDGALKSLAKVDFGSATSSVELLFSESFLATSCVVFSTCIAAYLVLRPFASGLVLSRAVRAPSLVRRAFVGAPEIRDKARALNTLDRERRAFAHIGLEPPRESRFDLLVRGLLPAGVLVGSAGIWKAGLDGVLTNQYTAGRGGEGLILYTIAVTTIGRPQLMLIVAACLACLGAAALGAIAYSYIHRTRGRSVLLAAHARPFERRRPPRYIRVPQVAWAGAAVVALALAFGGYAARDVKPPSIEADISSPITLAMARKSEFYLDLSCDEPCFLADVSMIESDSPRRLAPLARAWLDYEPVRLPARPARPFERDLRLRERLRVTLTHKQAAWLTNQLNARHFAGLALIVGSGRGCPPRCGRIKYTPTVLYRGFVPA